jgi:hypothetical protein
MISSCNTLLAASQQPPSRELPGGLPQGSFQLKADPAKTLFSAAQVWIRRNPGRSKSTLGLLLEERVHFVYNTKSKPSAFLAESFQHPVVALPVVP